MKSKNLENWINLFLGAWLIIIPWAIVGNSIANWNFSIVGAAIVIMAGMALKNLKSWEEWVNLTLGLWLIMSPWIFGYASDNNLRWNSLLVGTVVTVLSGFALPSAKSLSHVSK